MDSSDSDFTTEQNHRAIGDRYPERQISDQNAIDALSTADSNTFTVFAPDATDKGECHNYARDSLDSSTLPAIEASQTEDYGLEERVDSLPINRASVILEPTPNKGANYKTYDNTVHSILRVKRLEGQAIHMVKLRSGHIEEYTHYDLLKAPGGREALQTASSFTSQPSEQGNITSDSEMSSGRSSIRLRVRPPKFIDSTLNGSTSESTQSSRRQRSSLTQPRKPSITDTTGSNESSSDELTTRKRRSRTQAHSSNRSGPKLRQTRQSRASINYVDQLFEIDSSGTDLPRSRPGKRKRSVVPTRRSKREGRARGSMRERFEDEISDLERSASRGAPKVIGVRERFAPLSLSDNFRNRHLSQCDTCFEAGDSKIKGPLVFCQGCTLAYHAHCLGNRNGRAHSVTKVGSNIFALQCRRCVEFASKNEPTAPHQGKCQACHRTGKSCAPFQVRKTTKQEQEDRELNGGDDPVVHVADDLINNPENVLFRCTNCFQAFHLYHLPPRHETLFEADDELQKAEKRWTEYCEDWMCHFCRSAKATVGKLIAWRPIDPDKYVYGTSGDSVIEDEKEYLIKWHNKSYMQSNWMPGPWVWGVTHKSMRTAFARDESKSLPIMRIEDAIPEDFLRVDIVFQVEYNNIVKEEIEEVDLARVSEIERALVKYKGLSYEDTVWERPPDSVEDPERWADFKTAYEDWVRGKYIRYPPSSTLGNRIRKFKSQPFEKESLKEQPKSLVGGQLMDYQLDGLNWIYYQWHRNHNAILADEMGLGKTIQVIGFMAILVARINCWPFLVVAPNATCANWKREFKKWTPSLRVVSYFGSAKARELTEKYELFHIDHGQNKDNRHQLRCHIVITSYEAAQDVTCQRILKRIPWQALIVDEGQRLKSDATILYHALSQLRIPFKLLLTGTPLQNNQRELFNLLQFLDSSINAEDLEKKYEHLDKTSVTELHDMLKPFFLRRTKAQVLKFLPTMAQVIVPVTMTPLQKQLYKSILAKNAELLKSIFGGEHRYTAKGGLRNILMQLRKCLCHPFVYNIAIEERSSESAISHRRLVEASSKLQLLEVMLPKLQERGHRVLIFSQFLDMLTLVEDFLQGLAIEHIRLDGTMGSLEKQRCIDKFNAPDSTIFAFLLSTRAGGVGINLASADTVIILDPDFNPHQDIQAISRAHRLGQTKKVLIFQIMTRGSAEEKIMQIGKKKMALDHVLIEAMEEEKIEGNELEDVLRFGAEALFKDDGPTDILYDSASVDKLLDRSQIEDTKAGKDGSAESQFSFARIWQNESQAMEENLGDGEETPVNPTVWDAILKERARQHEIERKNKENTLGRGKRNRKAVDYHDPAVVGASGDVNSLLGSDNDTDFKEKNGSGDESSSTQESVEATSELANELKSPINRPSRSKIISDKKIVFQRASLPPSQLQSSQHADTEKSFVTCLACNTRHRQGNCPLKRAGVEYCPLCGEAHYGYQRTCPQLSSESAVREMMEALKHSTEDSQLKERAKIVLQGIKGNIVAKKKNDAMKRTEGLHDSNGNRSKTGIAQNANKAQNTLSNHKAQPQPPYNYTPPQYPSYQQHPSTAKGMGTMPPNWQLPPTAAASWSNDQPNITPTPLPHPHYYQGVLKPSPMYHMMPNIGPQNFRRQEAQKLPARFDDSSAKDPRPASDNGTKDKPIALDGATHDSREG